MYKISLSNKEDVYVKEEQYKSILESMNNNFVLIGEELINPSFIISITKVTLSSVPTKYLPKEEMEGYIDEKRGVFVVTKSKEIKKISDDLSSKFQIKP